MKTNLIDINLDKKCVRCGKGGATQGGYCLKCIIKNMDEGKYDHILTSKQKQTATSFGSMVIDNIGKLMEGKQMSKIGEKTIGFLQETISGLIRAHAEAIDEAYIKSAGDKLNISIGATIAPGRGESLKVKVGISFVTDRVKEEMEADIDEAQGSLFKK